MHVANKMEMSYAKPIPRMIAAFKIGAHKDTKYDSDLCSLLYPCDPKTKVIK